MFILVNSGDTLVMREMNGLEAYPINLTLVPRISHRLPKTASTTLDFPRY
jgi:hypothetical protein